MIEPHPLEIPTFLKRKKEPPMTHHDDKAAAIATSAEPVQGTTVIPVHVEPAAAKEPPSEITIDMIMEQIKKLSAKRDEITVTLSGLKKQAQRMIGQL